MTEVEVGATSPPLKGGAGVGPGLGEGPSLPAASAGLAGDGDRTAVLLDDPEGVGQANAGARDPAHVPGPMKPVEDVRSAPLIPPAAQTAPGRGIAAARWS